MKNQIKICNHQTWTSVLIYVHCMGTSVLTCISHTGTSVLIHGQCGGTSALIYTPYIRISVLIYLHYTRSSSMIYIHHIGTNYKSYSTAQDRPSSSVLKSQQLDCIMSHFIPVHSLHTCLSIHFLISAIYLFIFIDLFAIYLIMMPVLQTVLH